MKKLFIDSDIILDLLTRRNDYESAAMLLTMIENGDYQGFTSPIVLANVHYIMTKYTNRARSLKNLKMIRKILSVLSIDEHIIDEALESMERDFEDSIQFIEAYKHGIDIIITRNKKDYLSSKVPVLSARELVNIFHHEDCQS